MRVRRRRLDLDLRRVRAGIAHGHRPEVASDTSSNNTLEGLLSRVMHHGLPAPHGALRSPASICAAHGAVHSMVCPDILK